jgi:hypothetical protein
VHPGLPCGLSPCLPDFYFGFRREYRSVFEEFPAYSSVLLRRQIHLRTVIVTAAIHQGFDSKLPPYGLTSPVNLLALGRCQPLYVVFRLCRDLCFC